MDSGLLVSEAYCQEKSPPDPYDAPHNALRCEAHKNKSAPANTPEQRYDAEDFRSGDAFLAGFDMDRAIDALMGDEWGL